ncbi:MAG: hypothetical protein HKL80_00115 [Acidimicrobiales bacterium]|nr:hypothetical protein [Acidimicrobiales bacterium]
MRDPSDKGHNGDVTVIESIASWARSLCFEDIPVDVVELLRAQRRSVIASVASSINDDASKRILNAVKTWSRPGNAPLFGSFLSDESFPLVSVEDALYAASAQSIALDFDDYICFGHTGHSSVLVPILLSCETGTDVQEQLVNQVIANEIGARLGGACLLGPLNGQLWSFIHAGATAVAAGRMLGLDEKQLANSLAISLTAAPRPTAPGFMAPDTKLITAAEPILVGLRAARLGASSVTGPLDVLEHPHGFFEAFSYAPLTSMFNSLGKSWATRTMSAKMYPGCAYIDTAVDALLELTESGLRADSVDSVIVKAGIMTCGMNAMSSGYSSNPTPVTVNFSIPLNVATVLIAGELTPNQINAKWLLDNSDAIASLSRKTTLQHDFSCTKKTADAFVQILPIGGILGEVDKKKLVAAIGKIHSDHSSFKLSFGEMSGLVSTIPEVLQMSWNRLKNFNLESGTGENELMGDLATQNFKMTFPAIVDVKLKNGETLHAQADVPKGGAGNIKVSPITVAREKFDTWAPLAFGQNGASAISNAIDEDSDLVASLLDSK